MDGRDIIRKPIVSEKSYVLIEENVYTFEVHPEAVSYTHLTLPTKA